jgi:bromodomain-containing protein 7/9
VEDPFSVLAFFVSDAFSHLLLTPLYAPKEPTDTSLHTPVTLPFPDKRPTPQVRNATHSITPRGKRCHWTISRNAPSRGKVKERDDDDSNSNSWQVPREMQTVDWGALAVLEGLLREEMDKRAQGVGGETEEKLLHVIRESVDPDDVENLDISRDHWSLERSKEAKAYVRDVVYGGVDGFAYVRSLAEFVGSVDYPMQVSGSHCLIFSR